MFTATPKHVVEAMARESVDILATDPELAYFAFVQLLDRLPKLQYPKLTISTADLGDGETEQVLTCPYCSDHLGADDLIAVDAGYRWTYGEQPDHDNLTVGFHYDERIDGGDAVYMHAACERPVSMPEGWKEEAL
jgi:hypothetical protein